MKSCVKRTAVVAMDCRKTVRSQDFDCGGKTARWSLGARDLLVDTLPGVLVDLLPKFGANLDVGTVGVALPELLEQRPVVRQDADEEDRNDDGMEPSLMPTISPKPENKDSK